MIAGLELRKERNLGQIIGDSYAILRTHWRPLGAIAVPVIVTSLAFQLIVFASNDDFSKALFNGKAFDNPSMGAVSILAVIFFVPITIVARLLSFSGGIAFLSRLDRGESITSAESLDEAQAHLVSITPTALRAGGICLGFSIIVVGIPLAINRLVRWVFFLPAIIVDGVASRDALARSADLVKGQWWKTLGRLLVAFLAIELPVNLVASVIASASPGVFAILVSSTAGFVTTPYLIIALTLIFFDLKARRREHDNLSSA